MLLPLNHLNRNHFFLPEKCSFNEIYDGFKKVSMTKVKDPIAELDPVLERFQDYYIISY